MTESGLEAINKCGIHISFFKDETYMNKKVNKSNFCNNRFCHYYVHGGKLKRIA